MPQQILVVEDDKAMRWLLMKQLEKLNLPSESAMNGVDAVKKLARQQYSLIIMDVNLSTLGGFEAAKLIRLTEQENNRTRTPIVAVTNTHTKQACLQAGMDDCYQLPISIAEMRELVERWLTPRTNGHD